MRPEATSVCGLKLLVYEALSWCMRLTYCDIGYDLRAMDYWCVSICAFVLVKLTYCDIGYDLRAMDYFEQSLVICEDNADLYGQVLLRGA
jgi:hypothetical protein